MFNHCDYYDDPSYDDLPAMSCPDCRESEQTLDEAQNFLSEIVKQLYINKSFDKEHFEFALQELCHLLKVTLPDTEINLLPKPSKIYQIGNWIEANNTFLRNLTK